MSASPRTEDRPHVAGEGGEQLRARSMRCADHPGAGRDARVYLKGCRPLYGTPRHQSSGEQAYAPARGLRSQSWTIRDRAVWFRILRALTGEDEQRFRMMYTVDGVSFLRLWVMAFVSRALPFIEDAHKGARCRDQGVRPCGLYQRMPTDGVPCLSCSRRFGTFRLAAPDAVHHRASVGDGDKKRRVVAGLRAAADI